MVSEDVIDLASIVILAPVVDVFLGTDKNMGGDLSVKLMEFMSLIGIPITLVGVLSALLLINFLKVLINIISQRALTIVLFRPMLRIVVQPTKMTLRQWRLKRTQVRRNHLSPTPTK